jgi:hypothetical protein
VEGDCFAGVDGCVKSEPGVRCAACEGASGSGWVNGSACVYERFTVGELARSEPGWDACGLGQCLERGRCVVSRRGSRCDSCSGRGFVVFDAETYEPTCECYSPKYDPRAGCRSLYDEAYEDEIVTDARERIECVAHRDSRLGFYQDARSAYKYGDPKPGVPETCVYPLGPPPGQLTETGNPPYQTCNTVGGPDPDVPEDLSFKTCSYHGEWNATSRACRCYAGWKLVDVGAVDPGTGLQAQTCGECAGEFGPLTPDRQVGLSVIPGPYCAYPYLEDEFGVRRECSGHGAYENGECACFASSATGWWASVEVRGVQTCARCAAGYGGSDCKTLLWTASPALGTGAPTIAPTSAPTRNSSCVPCMERVLGALSLVSLQVGEAPANFTSGCCTHDAPVYFERGIWFGGNGTCLSTSDARYALGFELCDLVQGCEAFSWYPRDLGFAYEIYNATDFGAAPNEYGGSALACARTGRPTRRPTFAPTPYPTSALDLEEA